MAKGANFVSGEESAVGGCSAPSAARYCAAPVSHQKFSDGLD